MRSIPKLAGAVFAIGLAACCVAQTAVPITPGKLELRLLPESVVRKIPQAFTILMLNGTDHDVHVPTPSLECGDAPHGTIPGLVLLAAMAISGFTGAAAITWPWLRE